MRIQELVEMWEHETQKKSTNLTTVQYLGSI